MKPKKLSVVPVTALLLTLIFISCDLVDPDEPGTLVPKTVDEDPTLPSIDINGTKLHAETFGNSSNPVILVIHGGPGGDYRSLLRLKDLQDEYFLVYWDQKGAGLSKRHDADEISVDIYIDELDAIIDKYRINATDKINIYAHSWGGQIATFYIDDNPQRAMLKVNRMVFSDPGPFTGALFETMGLTEISLSDESINNILWSNEFISRDSHERFDYALMIGTADFAPLYFFSTTDIRPLWRLGAVANAAIIFSPESIDSEGAFIWDWTANLSQFTNEILFIRNGLNEIHTPEYFVEQMANYPSTRLVTIEGAGHDGPWIRSNEYMALIRTHFAE